MITMFYPEAIISTTDAQHAFERLKERKYVYFEYTTDHNTKHIQDLANNVIGHGGEYSWKKRERKFFGVYIDRR